MRVKNGDGRLTNSFHEDYDGSVAVQATRGLALEPEAARSLGDRCGPTALLSVILKIEATADDNHLHRVRQASREVVVRQPPAHAQHPPHPPPPPPPPAPPPSPPAPPP